MKNFNFTQCNRLFVELFGGFCSGKIFIGIPGASIPLSLLLLQLFMFNGIDQFNIHLRKVNHALERP